MIFQLILGLSFCYFNKIADVRMTWHFNDTVIFFYIGNWKLGVSIRAKIASIECGKGERMKSEGNLILQYWFTTRKGIDFPFLFICYFNSSIRISWFISDKCLPSSIQKTGNTRYDMRSTLMWWLYNIEEMGNKIYPASTIFLIKEHLKNYALAITLAFLCSLVV